MNAKLLLIQTNLIRFWTARNARERAILMAAGSIVIVAIYVSIAWTLHQRITGIQRKLPDLLLNSYEIAAGSQTTAPRTLHAGDLRSDLFRILADRNLHADLRPLGSSQVEMRLPDQDAKSLLNDLNAIRQAADAHVISLQLRVADKGNAGATAVLERAP
jgi:type II secretory pathway component PulM